MLAILSRQQRGAEVQLPGAILKDDSHDQRPLDSSTTLMGMREATSAVAWPLLSFSPCQRPCPPDTPGPFLPPLRSPTHFPSHPLPPPPSAPPLFRAWLPVFRRLWPPPALSGCTASHIPRLPSSPSPLATTPPSLSLSDLYSGSGLPLPTPEVILNDNLKNRVCAL